MKIAVLVDRLTNYGGIERIVLLTAERFNADIYTGWYVPETTFPGFRQQMIHELLPYRSKLYNLPYRLRGRYLQYLFNRLDLEDNYDVYILHGGKSLEAAGRCHPNIWYCHSPTKWLYNPKLYSQELSRRRFPVRQIFQVACWMLRRRDQRNVGFVDKIAVNSVNIKKQVMEVYSRDSTVIYPPVDLSKFRYRETGDFYLSTARLSPDKRVDVIVSAFREMPDKKLVVASGGMELPKIKKMAEGCSNIEVLGWVSEETLADLYSTCTATICASLYEDFGMIAVESMAAGKPVIASGDNSGFSETIIDGKTGLLINPTKENIKKAVEYLTPEKAASMRKECEKKAEEYSEEKHINKMRELIYAVMKSHS